MKFLSLAYCKIGASGATQISNGIGYSLSLTGLNLAGNIIEDEGAMNIADAIDHPSFVLKHLNLAENNISDYGGAKLCRMLQFNRTMQTLDLRNNSLGEKSAYLLRQVSKKNSMLTKIYMENNLINLLLVEEITALTEANIDRYDRRKHSNIRKCCRKLKKDVSLLAINRETQDKDEAYQEFKDKLEVLKHSFAEQKLKVDHYESMLLHH